MPKGLSQQITIIDRKTGKEAKGLFALDPVNDPHARAALVAYAHSVEPNDYVLASNLRALVGKLEADQRDRQQQIAGNMEIPDWLLEQERALDNGSESNS